MKNSIYIDIDSERDQQVLIGKPPEIKPPETPEEAANMILLDITCVCSALCSLIDMADHNGYAKKEGLIETSIKHLNKLLEKKPTENTETKTEE